MSDAFDPYLEWLGIPPPEQPPHYYRLLGVRVFENDARSIDEAADRRMAQLRTAQIGRRADLSQQLLNEVAAARACLMHPQRRAEYDAALKRRFGEQPIRAAPSAPLNAEQPLASPAEASLSSAPPVGPSLDPLPDVDPVALAPLKANDPLLGDAPTGAYGRVLYDPLYGAPGYKPGWKTRGNRVRTAWVAALVVLTVVGGLTGLLVLAIVISVMRHDQPPGNLPPDAPPTVAAGPAAGESPLAPRPNVPPPYDAPKTVVSNSATASPPSPPPESRLSAPPPRTPISRMPGWSIVELRAGTPVPRPRASSNRQVDEGPRLEIQQAQKLTGHTDQVLRLDFSRDGTFLASRTSRGQFVIWDVVRFRRMGEFNASVSMRNTHDWSPVEDLLVYTEDFSFQVRRPDGRQVMITGRKEFSGVAYTVDGSRILVGGKKLYSLRKGRGLTDLYDAGGQMLGQVEPAADGKIIAVTGGDEPSLRFLIADSHREPIESLAPHGRVREVKWSRNGKYFAYASLDYVYITSRATGKEIERFNVAMGGTNWFAFLHGGDTLVLRGRNCVELWDVATHRQRLVLKTPQMTTAIAVAPDQETLAVSAGNDIFLWRISS